MIDDSIISYINNQIGKSTKTSNCHSQINPYMGNFLFNMPICHLTYLYPVLLCNSQAFHLPSMITIISKTDALYSNPKESVYLIVVFEEQSEYWLQALLTLVSVGTLLGGLPLTVSKNSLNATFITFKHPYFNRKVSFNIPPGWDPVFPLMLNPKQT